MDDEKELKPQSIEQAKRFFIEGIDEKDFQKRVKVFKAALARGIAVGTVYHCPVIFFIK